MNDADILVIGGGIAGAGAAYELAGFASVILVEQESQHGYHATGRSAASFTENYGTGVIRRLAKASRPFLENPPEGFCDHPILSPRGMITIARADQLDRLAEDLARGRALVPSIQPMDPAEAVRRVPILRPDYVAGAFIEPHSMEVDVHGLHQGFLRGAKARGAKLLTDAGVTAIERRDGAWVLTTRAGSFSAPILVNAAGAWADTVAEMAGVRPLGLVPKRRTALNIPVPDGLDMTGWPLINDVGDAFYFKRDAGQLFLSPSDATPSPPMDAYPDDMDIAIAVERLEQATTLTVRRVSHAWAGLRTFASDGSPVVGPDDEAEGFVWLAGQGGYGVKTSPALSRICAGLIRYRRLPEDILQLGLTTTDLTPDRLRRPASQG
jgi:D-arginine dehydrogenase